MIAGKAMATESVIIVSITIRDFLLPREFLPAAFHLLPSASICSPLYCARKEQGRVRLFPVLNQIRLGERTWVLQLFCLTPGFCPHSVVLALVPMQLR
jgi:hypothetical protein